MEARDDPAQGHDRVGYQTAPHPGVDGVAEGPHLDVGPHQAAQRGRERGLADVPVAGVGDDDHVGAQLVVVLLEQRRQRVRADLLLALDEHHDVDRKRVAVRPDRAQVRDDPGLVVCGTAAVEPLTALGRLERRRVPVGRVVLGLHVVVGVEQHGRRTGGPGLVRDHRGRPAVRADDVDLGEPLGAEEVGDRIRGAPHLTGPCRVGTHRLDADQVLEVRAEGRHQVAHRRAEVVGHETDLRTIRACGRSRPRRYAGRGRSAPGTSWSA